MGFNSAFKGLIKTSVRMPLPARASYHVLASMGETVYCILRELLVGAENDCDFQEQWMNPSLRLQQAAITIISYFWHRFRTTILLFFQQISMDIITSISLKEAHTHLSISLQCLPHSIQLPSHQMCTENLDSTPFLSNSELPKYLDVALSIHQVRRIWTMQQCISATGHEAQQWVSTQFQSLCTNDFPHLRHKTLDE